MAATRSGGIPQRVGPQRQTPPSIRTNPVIARALQTGDSIYHDEGQHSARATGIVQGRSRTCRYIESGPHCPPRSRWFDLITAAQGLVFPLKIHPPRLRSLFHVKFNLSTSAALANTTLAHFSCLEASPNYYFADLDDCRSAIMDRPPLPPNYMTPAGSKEQQYIKNDQPQFTCTYEGCGKPFGRKEHLARHMRARMHPFARLS